MVIPGMIGKVTGAFKGKGTLGTVGKVAGYGFTAVAGVNTYKDSRNQGNGVVGSAAKAVSEAFIADLIGMPAYLTGAVVLGASQIAGRAVDATASQARNLARADRPFMNNTFVDSQQAYTMRQAGMMQIQNSKMSTQRALMGNEAQYMHR